MSVLFVLVVLGWIGLGCSAMVWLATSETMLRRSPLWVVPLVLVYFGVPLIVIALVSP